MQQETDIAVIPGLYLELGEAFATRLVGAFAIAVWDSRNQRLILVRDRAGERPLFYARNQNEIIFATEIAALVGHGRLHVNLDQEALRKYLQFGIFPSPDTPFAEIRKVAPGELIQFDKTGMCRELLLALADHGDSQTDRHPLTRSIKSSATPSVARPTSTWTSVSF